VVKMRVARKPNRHVTNQCNGAAYRAFSQWRLVPRGPLIGSVICC
jgi:hypothetical protein